MSAWAAAAAAAAGAASGYFTGQQNRRNMKTDHAWKIRARRTAYQDTMYDMKKAGLNPMLAYMKGDTPMPSGSSASGGGEIGQGISNAVSAYQASTQKQIANAEIANKNAQTKNTQASTAYQQMVNEDYLKTGGSPVGKAAASAFRLWRQGKEALGIPTMPKAPKNETPAAKKKRLKKIKSPLYDRYKNRKPNQRN